MPSTTSNSESDNAHLDAGGASPNTQGPSRTVVLARLLLGHVRRTWLNYALLACCFQLIVPNYRVVRNLTNSLGASFFLIHLNEPVSRGHFVAFRHTTNGVYAPDMWWTKRVVGVEGDRVTREALRYFVNGAFVGEARLVGLSGRLLKPMVIPNDGLVLSRGQWFVVGDHPFSFDSRYSELGLVRHEQLMGRAYGLF